MSTEGNNIECKRIGDNNDKDKVNIEILPPTFHIPVEGKLKTHFYSK